MRFYKCDFFMLIHCKIIVYKNSYELMIITKLSLVRNVELSGFVCF